jgi:hypothetical protein
VYNGRLRFKVMSNGMFGIGLSTFLLLHEKKGISINPSNKAIINFFILFLLTICEQRY